MPVASDPRPGGWSSAGGAEIRVESGGEMRRASGGEMRRAWSAEMRIRYRNPTADPHVVSAASANCGSGIANRPRFRISRFRISRFRISHFHISRRWRRPAAASISGFTAAALALLGLATLAAPAAGQGVRGWSTTTVRFVDLRPLTGGGDDGGRPLATERAWLGGQDVGVTAWGLGLEGLSVTGLVRAREQFSGDLQWPLADDRFDLLVGYAQLVRGGFRLRVGRQQTPSGLGFSGFDGAALRWDRPAYWAEGFGGRSLARGLAETRRDALRGIEDFVPDQEAWLVGGAAGLRRGATAVSVRYQREIIGDRSGLVSERAATDGSTVLPGGVRLSGSVDYDVPFDRIGKAHVALQRAFADGRVLTEVEARRYVPYFELSTIWGFFDPVPYHEARVRAAMGVGEGSGIELAVAARAYDDPSTTTIFEPLEDRGWLLEASGIWAASDLLTVDAEYRLDWGTSAFLHSLDAAVSVRPTPDLGVRVAGTTFQQFEAFRLGDGRAWGASGGIDWQAHPRLTVDAGVSVLRHDAGRGDPEDEWSQSRGWLGVRVAFGDDPGLARRGRR